MHQSCVEINTISKRTQMSFHLPHITKEVHRVRPKRFLCPWYIQRKPCTYLVPRLTTCPCGQKQAFTWPTSPRSSIGCYQNDLWAYCTFGTNRACVEISIISKETKMSFQLTLYDLEFCRYRASYPWILLCSWSFTGFRMVTSLCSCRYMDVACPRIIIMNKCYVKKLSLDFDVKM
jgi:hypothetical protein